MGRRGSRHDRDGLCEGSGAPASTRRALLRLISPLGSCRLLGVLAAKVLYLFICRSESRPPGTVVTSYLRQSTVDTARKRNPGGVRQPVRRIDARQASVGSKEDTTCSAAHKADVFRALIPEHFRQEISKKMSKKALLVLLAVLATGSQAQVSPRNIVVEPTSACLRIGRPQNDSRNGR